MKAVAVVVFVVLCLASCKDGRPRGVLSEGKMEDVLYDYHLAQAMASTKGDSALYYDQLYFRSILARYGVTEKDYERSMVWYTRHTDVLYKIYTRLSERYEKQLQDGSAAPSASSVYATLPTHGDTANVWRGARSKMLSPRGLDNRYAFSLKADTSFRPRDRFVWHFEAQYIYSNGRKDATAVLNIRYANDSATVVVQPIYGSGPYEVSATAVDLPIRGIDGFVYVNEPWTSEVKLLYLSQFSLVRYHSKEKSGRKPLTPDERADSIKAVEAGKAAVATDAEKRFIDSIQRTAASPRRDEPHFKENTGKEPMHNSLLDRSRSVRTKH